MSYLLVINSLNNIDITNYKLVHIDENLVKEGDIFCFIPNRDITYKTRYNLCFLPYNKEKGWEYKNKAHAIHYKLGQDNCTIIDTDITYRLHKQLNLSFTEEVDIVLLVLYWIVINNGEVVLSHKPTLSDKQSVYLSKLIEEKQVKILNE